VERAPLFPDIAIFAQNEKSPALFSFSFSFSLNN
jgi:hypothetical protein